MDPMDHYNVSFEWQGSSAVRVFDLSVMDYDNDTSTNPSFLELQNVDFEEIVADTTDDHYNQSEILDDLSSIPSYGSFVKNLTRSEKSSFENVTNSTTIEGISVPAEMNANVMDKCAFNCTCETCLPMYGDNKAEEPINVAMLEDITDNDLCYGDVTHMMNEAECTTYMPLPEFLSVNDSVKLRLRNKILSKSNKEANDTTGACFLGIVSNM